MDRIYSKTSVPTKYGHFLENDRIQCDLCPRACHLKEGQRGLCFLRARANDQVVLTDYGYASSYHIDPIEKKPLHHFLPGTNVLSFGTIGCNLRCQFCQNWHISVAKDHSLLGEHKTPEEVVAAAKAANCHSVAFTYNEPIITLEYIVAVSKACRAAGIKTVAVTNGYICEEPRKEFFEYIDAANVDLKAFTEEFYQQVTRSHLQPVLDTLVYLKHHTNVLLEVTTLLIPGHNDTPEELKKLTAWMMEHLGPDLPLHFSAFHPAYKMLDVSRTPLETLQQAREIALRNGLKYVYTGNIYSAEGTTTYCANCGAALIKRHHYHISEMGLDQVGACHQCGTVCAGIFENLTQS